MWSLHTGTAYPVVSLYVQIQEKLTRYSCMPSAKRLKLLNLKFCVRLNGCANDFSSFLFVFPPEIIYIYDQI